MSDCIFCQIATGKIQGLRVFEDEKTLAIMDIVKDVDGHMLVIPKKHCKNILDCDRETLNAVMDTVRKVSRHLTEKCGYDGVNLHQIDAWPVFEGAKEDITDVYNRIRKKTSLSFL